MLSDRERQTLDELERELLLEEPDLVLRFELTQRTLRDPYDRSLAVIAGLALLLAAIAFLIGAYSQAVGLAVMSAEAAFVRRCLRSGHRPTGSDDA